jgi:hypothetical protein
MNDHRKPNPILMFFMTLFMIGLASFLAYETAMWHSTPLARYFHVGYQSHPGTILSFSYEVRQFGSGRSQQHLHVAIPIMLMHGNPPTKSLRPDNGYKLRGFLTREMAESDSIRIGRVGDTRDVMVNEAFTDSFIAIDRDDLISTNIGAFVGVGFFTLVIIVLLRNCFVTVYRLPETIRSRRAAGQPSPPDPARRRNYIRSDRSEHW